MTDPRGALWTAEQLAVLTADYPTKGARFVAAQIGRSETSCRIKACRLGIMRVFHEERRGKRVLSMEDNSAAIRLAGRHEDNNRIDASPVNLTTSEQVMSDW